MSAHSPGPWVAVEDEIVTLHGERHVADVPLGPDTTPTEWQANLHLIAAAPQLLEALRDLCDAIPDATVAADPPLGCWRDAARHVIATAEGRQP